MVKATRPIDSTTYPCGVERRCQQMGNALTFIDDVDDRNARQLAAVERLATGGRVKGGAIQVDPSAVIALVDDRRLELAEVGIGVVEPFGHETRGKAKPQVIRMGVVTGSVSSLTMRRWIWEAKSTTADSSVASWCSSSGSSAGSLPSAAACSWIMANPA